MILGLKSLKHLKLVRFSHAAKMRGLHVHAVDGKLSVTLGLEMKVKMTVGLWKTINSVNGPERIDFGPVVNAKSAAAENRGLAEKGTPTQCMNIVSQQPKPDNHYKKLAKK